MNINQGCGSLHPEVISRAVAANKAHIGIAFDGDADRMILCDEQGDVIDGDAVMAICALQMMKEGRLRQNTLVATVMSNLGLELAMQKAGGTLVRAAVGDRYVMEKMIEGGYNLGGEQSGHIIFLDNNTTGDGLISALQVLAIMKQTGKRLSDARGVHEDLSPGAREREGERTARPCVDPGESRSAWPRSRKNLMAPAGCSSATRAPSPRSAS